MLLHLMLLKAKLPLLLVRYELLRLLFALVLLVLSLLSLLVHLLRSCFTLLLKDGAELVSLPVELHCLLLQGRSL
jgi:hypothetical protein